MWSRGVVAALVSVSMWAGDARACSCLPRGTERMAEEADAVFIGRVTEVLEPMPGPDGVLSSGEPLIVTFAVNRAWKGALPPRLSLWTQGDPGSCGVVFERDHEYLVFTYAFSDPQVRTRRPLPSLYTNICMGTKPVMQASRELAVLEAWNADDEPEPDRNRPGQ
jgi:hypothetical protein